MTKHSTIRISGNNWIGIWQTSLNYKNCFILYWNLLNKPDIRFGITMLSFYFPIIGHRGLFSFHFYTWEKKWKSAMIGMGLLYLPFIEFRIGDGKSWWSIRCEQYYGWKLKRLNKGGF